MESQAGLSNQQHAREWGQIFFPAYNQRPHQGLALFIPEDVYTGRTQPVWQIRQAAMDQHYAEHIERYVNGSPVLPLPPVRMCINPDDGQSAERVLADLESFKTVPTPVRREPPEVVT